MDLIKFLTEEQQKGERKTILIPEEIKKYGGYMNIIQTLYENKILHKEVSYITEGDITIKWF